MTSDNDLKIVVMKTSLGIEAIIFTEYLFPIVRLNEYNFNRLMEDFKIQKKELLKV